MSQGKPNLNIPVAYDDEQESAKSLKMLTTILVSNIIYLRQFFDESDYTTIPYEYNECGPVNLRVLQRESSNPNVKRICDIMIACHKAIDNDYLKSLTLGVFVKLGGSFIKNPVELYKFDYGNGKLKLTDKSSKTISNTFNESGGDCGEQVFKMLKNVIESLHSMQPLSERGSYYLHFKFDYFDDLVPEDFAIDGFVPYTDSSKTSFSIGDELVNFGDGNVNTGFHFLNVQLETATSSIDKCKLTDNEKMKNPKRKRDEFADDSEDLNDNRHDESSGFVPKRRYSFSTDSEDYNL